MKTAIISISILLLTLLGGYLVIAPSDYIAPQGDYKAVIDDTNAYRHKLSLDSLTPSQKLTNAAQAKADDMCTNNYWSHNLPDGTAWYTFIDKSGYDYTHAGENLAREYTASDVVDAWIASPLHEENLRGDYVSVGIGMSECGGKNFTVAEYAN